MEKVKRGNVSSVVVRFPVAVAVECMLCVKSFSLLISAVPREGVARRRSVPRRLSDGRSWERQGPDPEGGQASRYQGPAGRINIGLTGTLGAVVSRSVGEAASGKPSDAV